MTAFEPRLALDGGPDGLDAYRALAPIAGRILTPTGLAAIEIGAGQSAPVSRLLMESGLTISEIRRDLPGVERCLVATR